jgi:hypothetical protein
MRGTLGEFVVKSGPAKKNKGLLEALNVGKLTTAKLVPHVVTSGPLGELAVTQTVSGPTKLGTGDFSKPSKPKKLPNILEELGVGKTIKPKTTGSGSSGGSDVSGYDFGSFNAALSGSAGKLNSFSASVIRSRQWTDAFSTSMTNAIRRIDAGVGGGSTTYQIIIDNRGVIGSKTETDKWLRTSLERLRREGKLP